MTLVKVSIECFLSQITQATVLEGHDLPTSMNRPRLHHQLLPMEVQHESDFDSVSYSSEPLQNTV